MPMRTEFPPLPGSIGAIAEQMLWLLQGNDRASIPTVGDHAYQHIWVELVTGARRPGEHLSDVEIAASLGISRTPVREALRRLVQEELVRADPRRGFWVREYSGSDIAEFYDVRSVLETLALRQGAHALSRDDLAEQLRHVESIRQRLATNPVRDFLQHDFQFHNLVIHSSGNGRLNRILATLRAQVSIFQIRDTGFTHRIPAALDGHERILNALLSNQVDLAASHLADHIADSRDAVIADFFPKEATDTSPPPGQPPAVRAFAPPNHRPKERARQTQAAAIHGEASGI
jgi:DNA-binding GntR family transcriptional regulator